MQVSGHFNSPVELIPQKKPDVYRNGGWVGPKTDMKRPNREKLFILRDYKQIML